MYLYFHKITGPTLFFSGENNNKKNKKKKTGPTLFFSGENNNNNNNNNNNYSNNKKFLLPTDQFFSIILVETQLLFLRLMKLQTWRQYKQEENRKQSGQQFKKRNKKPNTITAGHW